MVFKNSSNLLYWSETLWRQGRPAADAVAFAARPMDGDDEDVARMKQEIRDNAKLAEEAIATACLVADKLKKMLMDSIEQTN